jgi:hypothetical protein
MAILVPKIDERDQLKLVEQLRKLILYYCPEWKDIKAIELDKQADALIHIFARMMDVSIQRLNRVPEKNFLSFLDLTGVSLLPPRVAKAPLVFSLTQGATQYGFVKAGTQVAASLKDGSSAVFETESDLTVIAPQLVKAVSLNPRTDTWEDHSATLLGEAHDNIAELFHGKVRTPHRLYLGHKEIFSLKEPGMIILDIELAENHKTNPEQWEVQWYCYTDGQPTRLTPFTYNIANASKTVKNDPDVINLMESGQIYFPYISNISEIAIQGQEAETGAPGSWKNHWIYAQLESPIGNISKEDLPRIKKIKTAVAIEAVPATGTGTVSSQSDVLKGDKTLFKEEFAPGDMIIAKNQIRIIERISSNTLLTVNTPFYPDMPEETAFCYQKNHGKKLQETAPLPVTIPDLSFFNNMPIDLGKDFYPFGERPKFNDTFYIASKEVFSKTGATVTLSVTPSADVYGPANNLPATQNIVLFWEYWNGKTWAFLGESRIPKKENDDFDSTEALLKHGSIHFTCPKMETVKVNGEENYWVRVRITGGDYGQEATYWEQTVNGHYLVMINTVGGQKVKQKRVPSTAKPPFEDKNLDPGDTTEWIVQPATFNPPLIHSLTLSYQLVAGKQYYKYPEIVLTYNDFRYRDQTQNTLTEVAYVPFQPVADTHSTLYLAFDQDLANLPVTFFFPLLGETQERRDNLAFAVQGPAPEATYIDLKKVTGLLPGDILEFRTKDGQSEQHTIFWVNHGLNRVYWKTPISLDFCGEGSTVILYKETPVIAWEYWTGRKWAALSIVDGTKNFLKRSMVQFVVPDDLAKCCLFGEEHYWLRVMLEKGAFAIQPRVNAIYTNTVWGHNLATIHDEILGSSNGNPNQTFQYASFPVLLGQEIMVREIALTELERKQIISDEGEDAIDEKKDQAGNTVERWVRWHEVNNFTFSGPESRHYTLDRNNGKVSFGDSIRGMIPPAGKDNIKCSYYQSGGGLKGNVKAGTITQLRTTYPYIDKVTNPEAAEGGAGQEDLERVRVRGPQTIKNRDRAVTYEDFEWLVREASTKVAKVKCLPTTGSQNLFEPGKITIIVVPASDDPKPSPSPEFLSEIDEYLTTRTPVDLAAAAPRVRLIGPGYVRVGVEAMVEFSSISNAKIIEGRIMENLKQFFHPLTGGPDGRGWDFGRNVYLSEIYQVIENTDGVDYVRHLALQSSMQVCSLKLKDSFIPPDTYPRFSRVMTLDGQKIFNLAEAILRDIVMDTLCISGFREGDVLMLHPPGDSSGKHSVNLYLKTVNGDVLECVPEDVSVAKVFPKGSWLETSDGKIRTYIFNEVTILDEPCRLKVAVIEPQDQVMVVHHDEFRNTTGPFTVGATIIDMIYLEDNDLVYSGDYFINRKDELPFPYLVNLASKEIHDLNNEKPDCQIGEIDNEHRLYWQNFDPALLKLKKIDYCAYCFSPSLSKK